MTLHNRFQDEFHKRQKSEISRETYWANFRTFLRELSNFKEFQHELENRVHFVDNEIIVDLKATRSHTARIEMLLNVEDIRSVPFSVLADGFYEPYHSDLLVDLGKLSSHFLDIGANMGFYSLALALENPELHVDAFEPQTSVFSTLEFNIKRNLVSQQITAHNLGLGKDDAKLTMFVPKFTGSGGASFQNLHQEEGLAEEVIVEVKVLDEIISSRIDLIKIDVEGSEFNVLIGAEKIISSSKPTVVVELLRKWMGPFGHSPQMFLEFMTNYGYECFAIGPRRLTPITCISESTQETNFIFCHKSRQQHYQVIHDLTD